MQQIILCGMPKRTVNAVAATIAGATLGFVAFGIAVGVICTILIKGKTRANKSI